MLWDWFGSEQFCNKVQTKNVKTMKSFKQLCAQLERIYALYLKGYGSKKLVERAEQFLCGMQNVGLQF